MTTFEEVSSTAADSNVVYEMNSALIDALDVLKIKDRELQRREKIWKTAGRLAIVAPLVSAASYMEVAGKNLSQGVRGETVLLSIITAAISWMSTDVMRDRVKRKAQDAAAGAVPISMALNNSLQPWISRRIEQKAIDEAKMAARYQQF